MICVIFSFQNSKCPFEYYKTEPYISLPLLSILSASQLKADLLFGDTSAVIGARSFYAYNGVGTKRSFNNDFTRDKSNETADADSNLKLASLGLAVWNIFNDLVVRRVVGFLRFIHLSSAIWKAN